MVEDVLLLNGPAIDIQRSPLSVRNHEDTFGKKKDAFQI